MPLPDHLRAEMEARFGVDFGDVRIHNDPAGHVSAGSMNAKAYTQRDHIVFGPGGFAPGSVDGKRLLAHELAHVIQQRRGRNATLASGASEILEGTAEAAADTALSSGSSVDSLGMAGKVASSSAATAPAIQCAPDDELERQAKQDADLDVANASTIRILYATRESTSIDELLQAGQTVEGYFLNATGPRTRVAAAQSLQQIRDELQGREATAARDADGTLLKKDFRGVLPWNDQRPKQLEDIYPFGPQLMSEWSALDEESSGGTQGDSLAASQGTEQSGAKQIATHLDEPRREVTEEASTDTPGPEIRRGFAQLEAVTVGDALTESGDLFHEATSALPADVPTCLCSRLVADSLYREPDLSVGPHGSHRSGRISI